MRHGPPAPGALEAQGGAGPGRRRGGRRDPGPGRPAPGRGEGRGMSKANSFLQKFGANITQAVEMRPGGDPAAAAAPTPAGDRYAGGVRSRAFAELPVDSVERDQTQPREEFAEEDLRRLAESIRRFGQLAPIRVRRDEARGKWVVLVGERRLRACRLAGLERVRVEFVERAMTEADVLAEQVVENAVRA